MQDRFPPLKPASSQTSISFLKLATLIVGVLFRGGAISGNNWPASL
jgi:hypothetical protein